jgi:membrane associated rhomboid family serine protease
MIPLKDRTLRRRFPFVNILLILTNIAVFFFMWSLPDPQLNEFVFEWGFVPARFFAAETWNVDLFAPLFSSMFMHGGWLHLGSNMLSLWIFGDNVEDRLGHLTYLAFYLISGMVATFSHALVAQGSPIPVVGASGAIAGVLGAYLLLFPRARVVTIIPIFFFFFIRDVSAFFFIAFWFVLQLFYGVAALDPMMAQAGIAWWAHIGGFVAGLLLAIPLGGRNRPYLPHQDRPTI